MVDIEQFITLTTTLFIVTNPLGNSPAILALIKDYPIHRQRVIMVREGIAALVLAIFFQYFGEYFLGTLMLQDYTIALCGGILLLLIAIDLIFPSQSEASKSSAKHEPFIVPIATPMLAGPGLLTIVMLYSKKVPTSLTLTLALCAAWVVVCAVLLITPYLQRLIGNKGIKTLEQMMGLVLSLISVEMIVRGLYLFIETLK